MNWEQLQQDGTPSHADARRAAGFAHAGLVWRGLGDAVVVGVRSGPWATGRPATTP